MYSFKKSLKKGSVSLIPIEKLAEKMMQSNAMLRTGANQLHSQTPSHAVLNLNDSNFTNQKRLNGNMTMTENMFSASKAVSSRNA